MSERKFHPACEIFPTMDPERFEDLKKSIKDNGLLEKIVLDSDGLIVDGRHRYRACLELGVEPEYEDAPLPVDQDICAYVWAKNAVRRDLDASQRAAIAVSMEELVTNLKAEAAERKGDRTDLGINGDRGSDSGRTREKLSEVAKVSPASIARAQRIQKEDPVAFEEIKAGKKTLHKAAKELKERKELKATKGKAPEPKGDADPIKAAEAEVLAAFQTSMDLLANFKSLCKKAKVSDRYVKVVTSLSKKVTSLSKKLGSGKAIKTKAKAAVAPAIES